MVAMGAADPGGGCGAPRPGWTWCGRAATASVVYVGMAGERGGAGIRGRLAVYSRGKGLVSGVGEAVMDRVLADAGRLGHRLGEVEQGRPMRGKASGRAALDRADLRLRWAVTVNRAVGLALERAAWAALSAEPLWNRSW